MVAQKAEAAAVAVSPAVAAAEEEKRKKKAAKAAEAAAKLEAERKAREEKEAVKLQLESVRAEQRQAARDVLQRDVRGAALAEQLLLAGPLSASAVLAEMLLRLPTPPSLAWTADGEFGAALQATLASAVPKEQQRCVSCLQSYCHSLAFPKLDKNRYLVDVLFQLFYSKDWISEEAFLLWADDDELEADDGSKLKAVIQTTAFIQLLQNADEQEELDDDEVDAPMTVVR